MSMSYRPYCAGTNPDYYGMYPMSTNMAMETMHGHMPMWMMHPVSAGNSAGVQYRRLGAQTGQHLHYSQQHRHRSVYMPMGKHRRKRALTELPPGVTTLVVRNVPWELMVEDLLSVWPPQKDRFDFLHLPMDEQSQRTTTYAFLNFTSHEAAVSFNERWHGHFLPDVRDLGQCQLKSLNIAVAKSQGIYENLGRFSLEELNDMARYGAMPLTFAMHHSIDPRIIHAGLGLSKQAEKEPSTADGAARPDDDFVAIEDEVRMPAEQKEAQRPEVDVGAVWLKITEDAIADALDTLAKVSGKTRPTALGEKRNKKTVPRPDLMLRMTCSF